MKNKLIVMSLLPVTTSPGGTKETEPGYSGKDLTGSVEITRDKQTKAAKITVDAPGRWMLYAGPNVDNIDLSEQLITGDKKGIYDLEVPRDRRCYFQFVSGPDRAILAERLLPMTGGYNTRDLGGYRTSDGRYVKWGKILRSDDLHELTGTDLAYLGSVPVASVVDFRSPEEDAAAPDKLPSVKTKRYELPVTPGSLDEVNTYLSLTPPEVENKMEWMYEYFATSDEGKKQYRELFRILQDGTDTPLLFHCSAGKDRTGMAAALILYALRVPQEIIMNDYMASNIYLKGKYSKYAQRFPQLAGIFEVKPQYLNAGIGKISKEYGSVDNFLRDELGVNIESFRESYLY